MKPTELRAAAKKYSTIMKEKIEKIIIEAQLGNIGSWKAAQQVLDLFGVTNRTFKCNRCGTIYTLIDGDTVGCCVTPVEHRTSGICGGELIEVL